MSLQSSFLRINAPAPGPYNWIYWPAYDAAQPSHLRDCLSIATISFRDMITVRNTLLCGPLGCADAVGNERFLLRKQRGTLSKYLVTQSPVCHQFITELGICFKLHLFFSLFTSIFLLRLVHCSVSRVYPSRITWGCFAAPLCGTMVGRAW